jgi:heparinase II/III-like protein
MTSGGTWKGRIARLAAMDRAEMVARIRQYSGSRADGLRHRFELNFIPKVEETKGVDTGRFFFAPAQVRALCDILTELLPGQTSEIVKRAERVCQHRFDLLGYEGLDYGTEIDWHCDQVHGKRAPRKLFYAIRYLDFEQVGDSKITWELNRHQHFVSLAKAYRLTGDERFVAEIVRQWQHWHAENPYPVGINWASSLEVSFRTLSWFWMYFLLADSPSLPSDFHEQWLRAQALNGRHIERYLSTYFSPNTHLLGEAVALFFLGTLCGQLSSAARWKQRGWEIILQEARRQVRPDGFHFEQSTYYHVYALDFFLHAAVLATTNDLPLPAEFERTLEKMLEALLLISRGGLPPSFGDDDGGRVFDPARNRVECLLDPLATGAVLFNRGDFKFAAGGLREETLWLLGEAGVAEWDKMDEVRPRQDSVALPDSGIYLMPSGGPGPQLVVDAGPIGALAGGHGHADMLSLCVMSNGRGLLIDPGTFEYVGPGPERNVLRGTGAHNTLRVDGAGQADLRGPFSWQQLPVPKAEQWIQGETFDLFVGSHDGYSRLASPVVHRRWVFSLKGHFWLVRDLAVGKGAHRLEISWHFGSEMQVQKENVFGVRNGDERMALLTVEGHGWSEEGHKDWWSPCYGQKQANLILNFSTTTELPAEFVTLLMPLERQASNPGKITFYPATNQEGTVKAYRLNTAEAGQGIYFGKVGEAWKSDVWSSDSEFLYWRMDERNQLRHLILCNGSWAGMGEKRLVTCERKVTRCEVISKDTGLEISSSDLNAVKVQHPFSFVSFDAKNSVGGNAEVPEMAKES